MASGLGLKNIVYQGDLNDIGDTASSPSPQGMYSYLLGKGAAKGEALMLTGAAASESDFRPPSTARCTITASATACSATTGRAFSP